METPTKGGRSVAVRFECAEHADMGKAACAPASQHEREGPVPATLER